MKIFKPAGKFSLWRGLYGSQINDCYSGVTDSELRTYGFSFDNRSLAQNHPLAGFMGLNHELIGKVDGLPVSFLKSGAERFVKNRKYLNLPALVEVRIPLTTFIESNMSIKIDGHYATEVTPEMIESHLKKEVTIRGEAYLQRVNEEALRDQHFYRPQEVKQESGIYLVGENLNWREIKLRGGLFERGRRSGES